MFRSAAILAVARTLFDAARLVNHAAAELEIGGNEA
jgi:hypothetical protein